MRPTLHGFPLARRPRSEQRTGRLASSRPIHGLHSLLLHWPRFGRGHTRPFHFTPRWARRHRRRCLGRRPNGYRPASRSDRPQCSFGLWATKSRNPSACHKNRAISRSFLLTHLEGATRHSSELGPQGALRRQHLTPADLKCYRAPKPERMTMTVRSMILMSNARLAPRMYSRSKNSFFCADSASSVYPTWICASPVIPGRTSCRR